MALLAGGIGLYRINQNASSRMDAAARTLGALCMRARTEALMTHQPVRLLVDVDAGSNGYLKSLFVCVYRNGVWQVVGGAAALPRGVGVLPGDSNLLEGDWPGVDSVFSDAGSSFILDPDGRGSRVFQCIEFSADGRADSLSEADYLQTDLDVSARVLSLCFSTFSRRGEGHLVFDNPDMLSVLEIMPSGDCRVVGNR